MRFLFRDFSDVIGFDMVNDEGDNLNEFIYTIPYSDISIEEWDEGFYIDVDDEADYLVVDTYKIYNERRLNGDYYKDSLCLGIVNGESIEYYLDTEYDIQGFESFIENHNNLNPCINLKTIANNENFSETGYATGQDEAILISFLILKGDMMADLMTLSDGGAIVPITKGSAANFADPRCIPAFSNAAFDSDCLCYWHVLEYFPELDEIPKELCNITNLSEKRRDVDGYGTLLSLKDGTMAAVYAISCSHENIITVENIPATCYDDGKIVTKCLDCEEITTTILPKLNHNIVNGYCSHCGKRIDDKFYYAVDTATNTLILSNSQNSQKYPNLTFYETNGQSPEWKELEYVDDSIFNIIIENDIYPVDCSWWFTKGYPIQINNISGLEFLHPVDSVESLFAFTTFLNEIDFNKMDVSTVRDFNGMFAFSNFYNNVINLSGWDTSNAINMEFMFYDCKELTTIYSNGFDISNVTNSNNMFGQCYDLTGAVPYNSSKVDATMANHITGYFTHLHNYELTSQTEATCTQSGSATYTCVDNDDSYTEIISSLGHNIVNGICTRCGFKVLSVKKQLKDQEEKKVYPKTVAEAITDDNGNPLMSLVQRFTAGEGIEIKNNEISVTYGFADRIKY